MLELGIQLALLLAVVMLCVTTIVRPRRLPAAPMSHAPEDRLAIDIPPGLPPAFGPRLSTPPDFRERSAILPLSTVSGFGQPLLAVFVFDPDVNGFRRVGVADAHGKVDLHDAAGDGIQLARGRLYRLVGRPQAPFKPNQIRVSEATPGGADAWLVHDVRVGSRSQFIQSGAVPAGALRDIVGAFETVQTAMEFSVDVSYQGPAEAAPFAAAVVGAAVDFAG